MQPHNTIIIKTVITKFHEINAQRVSHDMTLWPHAVCKWFHCLGTEFNDFCYYFHSCVVRPSCVQSLPCALCVVNVEAFGIIVIFIRCHILWEIIIFTSFITVHHLSHQNDMTMHSFVYSSALRILNAFIRCVWMNAFVAQVIVYGREVFYTVINLSSCFFLLNY